MCNFKNKIYYLTFFSHKVQIINLSWAINSRKLVCVGFNHHTVQVRLLFEL